MQCSNLTGMLQTQASHGHQRMLLRLRGVAIPVQHRLYREANRKYPDLCTVLH